MDGISGERKTITGEDSARVSELLCRTLLQAAAEGQQWPEEQIRKDGCETLLEIFYRVASRLHCVLLSAVVCAALLGAYAFFIAAPQYTATAKLYIMGQNSSSVLTDLQVGTYLTMDYQEVFRTWEVHEMVRRKLKLPYSYEEMQDMLTVSNPPDPRVLYITVKSPSAQEATNIANAYAEAAKKFILETMDSQEPSTFSLALAPGIAEGIKGTGYMAIGFLSGAVLSVAVIAVSQLFDNRPRTPEDIGRDAGLPTLGVIPAAGTAKKGGKT